MSDELLLRKLELLDKLHHDTDFLAHALVEVLWKEKDPLLIRRINEVTQDAGPTDWVWQGFLATGALTVLAGQPKIGKSTLLFGLMRQMALPQGRFMGLPVASGDVLLLTEERAGTLAEKAEFFHMQPNVHVCCRHEVRMGWEQVVEEAVKYMHDNKIRLLIVDTFDKWGHHDENNPRQVVEALEPLVHAAGSGLAVLVVHHQRKGGGQYGEGVRGSNALTGGVDVVVELERAADLRILRSVSRFRDTPPEVMVSLQGNLYKVIEGQDRVDDLPVFSPFEPWEFQSDPNSYLR